MEHQTESTPLQRGAIRMACLFVAVGLWIMLVNRTLVWVPVLGHLFDPRGAVPFSYGVRESWFVFVLIALFPLMVTLGDVAGTTLARAVGGRVLTFAASTDLLLGAGGAALFVASGVLASTYGAPAGSALLGLWMLLVSAHIAHVRRTAAKMIWVTVGLFLLSLALSFPRIYPAAAAGGYAAAAVLAILIDARLTGQGYSAAERSWLAVMPLATAAFVFGSIVFTLVDTGIVLGVNVIPFVERYGAGDLKPLEKGVEHVLSLRPDQPVATFYLGFLRLRQGRWDEADALLRPFGTERWSGGELGFQAAKGIVDITWLRELEKKHGAGSLALAKAVEAGEAKLRTGTPEDRLLLAIPLYERAAAKDPAARPELERVQAIVRKNLDALKPKPAPSPSASPSPRG